MSSNPTRKAVQLTLIGGEHSFFSAKARSYLRYKGQQGDFFQEALATLDMYRQAILPLVGVNFIPVLLVHDEHGNIQDAIQDTSLIVDYLEKAFPHLPSVHPTTPKQRFVSYLIELWADEWLKMPAMHYRWSFLEENQKYLVHEWGKVSTPHLSVDERDQSVLNAKSKGASFNAMRQTLPLLGITPETIPELERSFLDLLQLLEAHFRQHSFLLGERPCLGDFALIGPFYAHLYRDPKPSSILRSKAPVFCEYIERMNGLRPAYEATFSMDSSGKRLVAPPEGVAQFGRVYAHGEFLPNDTIPDTIVPMISKIFQEHIPILLSTCQGLAEYLKESDPPADQVLPRSIGFHGFQWGNARSKRLSYPYDVWMLQRCLDSIGKDEEQIVFPFIKQFQNGQQLLDKVNWIKSDLRLKIVKFKLYRDSNSPLQSKI